jgi:hypothetical protein
MGYTIYWEPIYPVSQAVWNTFEHRALILITHKRTGKVETEKNVLSFEGAEGENHETFYVSKEPEGGANFCKTARMPYTTDVFICLILMFDLGMIKGFHSDDMNEQYPEALEYVKKHYALKRSYAKLEKMGRYEHSNNNPIKSVSPLSQRPRKHTYKKKAEKKERKAKKTEKKERKAKKTFTPNS